MKTLTKIKIFLFSFFLLLYGILFVIITSAKNDLINHTLSHEIENLENSYRVSINNFNLISNNFYNFSTSFKHSTNKLSSILYMLLTYNFCFINSISCFNFKSLSIFPFILLLACMAVV